MNVQTMAGADASAIALTRKSLGHMAVHTRPGESRLAGRLFEVLGCRVQAFGPLPGTQDDYFYIVALDGVDPDRADNILFVSPMQPEQHAFEQDVIRHYGIGTDDPHPLVRAFAQRKREEPEFFMHFGIHFQSLEALEDAIERIEAEVRDDPAFGAHVQGIQKLRAARGRDAEIDARMDQSRVFGTSDHEAYGAFTVQGHIRTDLFAAGLGILGSVLELDYVFTGAGRERNPFNSLEAAG